MSSSATNRVASVILAAGKAERMGQAKVLLEWMPNTTILEHIIDQLQKSQVVDPIIVITGAYGLYVTKIAQRAGAVTVHNPDYTTYDMLSSLKAGLRHLQEHQTIQGALVVLGDQPQIEITTIQSVVQAYWDGKGTIVAPQFDGQRGHPILFDMAHWDAICHLPDDAAPRALFAASPQAVFRVEIGSDSILRDIDTPSDYAEERKRAGLASL